MIIIIRALIIFLGSIFFPKVIWLLPIIFYDYFFQPSKFLVTLLIISLLFDFLFWEKIGFSLTLLSGIFMIIFLVERLIEINNLREKLIIGILFSFIFLLVFFFTQGLKSLYNIIYLSKKTIFLTALTILLGEYYHKKWKNYFS
jgi:hypothetical protein